jgi:hypothetical protein
VLLAIGARKGRLPENGNGVEARETAV